MSWSVTAYPFPRGHGANPSFVSGRGQGTPWISRQLIAGPSLMSNVGFSILLKDTSTCSSALPGAGIWTSDLSITSRPALLTELQPPHLLFIIMSLIFLLFRKTLISFIKITGLVSELWNQLALKEDSCSHLEKTVRRKTLHNDDYVLWVVYYVRSEFKWSHMSWNPLQARKWTISPQTCATA